MVRVRCFVVIVRVRIRVRRILDKLFKIFVYFASVIAFVEISGIQICRWLHEVSELSACDIVSVQLACDHTILASSG